jgi:hypothetical protein
MRYSSRPAGPANKVDGNTNSTSQWGTPEERISQRSKARKEKKLNSGDLKIKSERKKEERKNKSKCGSPEERESKDDGDAQRIDDVQRTDFKKKKIEKSS